MQPTLSRSFSIGIVIAAVAVHNAQATKFSVIANIPGGPQIGALRGKTIYGTVRFNGDGELFALTDTGSYSPLHSFDGLTDGAYPNASLAIDKHGNLFGTAQGGGANGAGTLWEYSSAGVMSTQHSFGGSGDGTFPLQGPTLDGKLIVGTASQGAINNEGGIFALSEKNYQYDMLYEFLSGADGHCPFSGAAVGTNGVIYGTTWGGGWGGNPDGSVWQYSASGGLQTLYVFQNGSDGEWPDQAPVVDEMGNIYGTTHVENGIDFAGAVWVINANGAFSVLYDLDGNKDGAVPNSPLLLDHDGNLYGTTESGGKNNFGTVFRVTPAGAFEVIHSFTGGSDGAIPTGNLVQNNKGEIFGGTSYGSVFRIKP